MFLLHAVATRRAGHVFLWGAAPPLDLGELAEALRRRGEALLGAGPLEIAFAFPEWTRPHRVIPQQIRMERGGRIRAPWAAFWLARFGYEEPRADVEGLTPEGQPVQLLARDLDLDAVEAYLAVPGWPRCAAGVWVEPGPSLAVRSEGDEASWAAAWLRAGLSGEGRRAFGEILEAAARQGRPWGALYREQEGRFDLESRRHIEGVLLLARAVRRYTVAVPHLSALAEIPPIA